MLQPALPGGAVTEVVHIAGTVRRSLGERANFVHQLLDHFELSRWPGAPRFVGVDEHGRESLTFLDGHVPWESPLADGVSSTESLVEIARLVR